MKHSSDFSLDDLSFACPYDLSAPNAYDDTLSPPIARSHRIFSCYRPSSADSMSDPVQNDTIEEELAITFISAKTIKDLKHLPIFSNTSEKPACVTPDILYDGMGSTCSSKSFNISYNNIKEILVSVDSSNIIGTNFIFTPNSTPSIPNLVLPKCSPAHASANPAPPIANPSINGANLSVTIANPARNTNPRYRESYTRESLGGSNGRDGSCRISVLDPNPERHLQDLSYETLSRNLDANLAEIDMDDFRSDDIHQLLAMPSVCGHCRVSTSFDVHILFYIKGTCFFQVGALDA